MTRTHLPTLGSQNERSLISSRYPASFRNRRYPEQRNSIESFANPTHNPPFGSLLTLLRIHPLGIITLVFYLKFYQSVKMDPHALIFGESNLSEHLSMLLLSTHMQNLIRCYENKKIERRQRRVHGRINLFNLDRSAGR